MIVVVETAGDGVACYVNVGPAIVVKVRRAHAKSVRAHRNPLLVDRCRRRQAARDRHTGSLGNVLKRSIAAIVVQDVRPAAEPLRPAPDGQPVIPAVLVLAGLRRHAGIEIHIVGDEQVEVAVTVVVHKTATCVPSRSWTVLH